MKAILGNPMALTNIKTTGSASFNKSQTLKNSHRGSK